MGVESIKKNVSLTLNFSCYNFLYQTTFVNTVQIIHQPLSC